MMLKMAYMVVTAALFTTGVAKTADTISARSERAKPTEHYTSVDNLADVMSRAP